MLLTLLTACLTSSEEYTALQDQLKDKDADGFIGRDDCDDTEAGVYPGATEIPEDGLDNDCDPSTDDALPPVQALSGTISAGDLASIGGPGAYFRFSQTLVVGDLSGDGLAEVLVGAPEDDTEGPQTGSLSIFEGPWQVGQAEHTLYGSEEDLDTTLHVGTTLARTALAGSPAIALGATIVSGEGAILVVPYPPTSEVTLLASVAAVIGPRTFPYALTSWSASEDWLVASDIGGSGAVYGLQPSEGLADLSIVGELIAEGGANGDALGHALATGDLDGDGQDELLVGAPGTNSGAGSVYILNDLGTGQFGSYLWTGDAGSAAGMTLASGDANADGYADFATTDGTGAVYLLLGPSHGGELADAEYSLTEGEVGAIQLSTDLDNDGDDDLAIGRPNLNNGGEVRVFYDLPGATLSLDDASLVVEAKNERDRLGESLAGGADLDGDGDEDLLIGAPEALGPNARDGAIYLVPGGGD